MKAKPVQPSTEAIGFTLEQALRSIVLASPIDQDRWKPIIEQGADDDEIKATLTFALGRMGHRVSSKSGICQLATKPKLLFWFGSYGSGTATLAGDKLVEKIREVLAIPAPAEAEEASNGTMQVLSETVGEEIVESFLPDDHPWEPVKLEELVQIQNAPAQDSPLPADWQAYGIKAHIIPLAIEALEKLDNGSLEWLSYKLAVDEVVGARLATWMERMGWIRLDYSRSMTNPDFEVLPPFHAESLTFKIPDSEIEAVETAVEYKDLSDEASESTAEPTALTPAEPEQLSFSFDYSELDDDTATIVRNCTQEIRERVVSVKKHTLVIAKLLLTVKRNLEVGQWSRWVLAETEMSVDTADKMTAIGKLAETSPQFAESFHQFSRSASYLLVAPSTPEAARQEAVGRAEAGEPITHEKAKEIVRTHKPAVTRERTTHTQTTQTVKEVETSEEGYPKGICRVCGCTEENPCVRTEDGNCCAWHVKFVGGAQVIDDTICSVCARQLPGWVHPVRSGQAEVVAATAPPKATAPRPAPAVPIVADDPWNKATIDINLHMFPWDGNGEGRLVQLTVKANDLPPKLVFKRYNELYGHPDRSLCLPPPAGDLIDWLQAELAKAPASKQLSKPVTNKPAAAARKKSPAKKSPAKSPAADRRQAEKPVFSKTKSKPKGTKRR